MLTTRRIWAWTWTICSTASAHASSTRWPTRARPSWYAACGPFPHTTDPLLQVGQVLHSHRMRPIAAAHGILVDAAAFTRTLTLAGGGGGERDDGDGNSGERTGTGGEEREE